MVRAHGYTQSPMQTSMILIMTIIYCGLRLITLCLFFFFFTFKAQPIQVHNGVAYVSHMGPEISRNGTETSS